MIDSQNNSGMDEAKNQINDLEHKEPKNNQSEQEEKRIPPHEDNINSLWDNLKKVQHLPHKGARRRRERARNENSD